jgi:hypothetical protein
MRSLEPEMDSQAADVAELVGGQARCPLCNTWERIDANFSLETRRNVVVDGTGFSAYLTADVQESWFLFVGVVEGLGEVDDLAGAQDSLVDGIAQFPRDAEEAGLRVEFEEALVLVLGLGLVFGELRGIHAVDVAREGFQKGFRVEDETAGIFEDGFQKKLYSVENGRRRCSWKESCEWCRCLLLSLID